MKKKEAEELKSSIEECRVKLRAIIPYLRDNKPILNEKFNIPYHPFDIDYVFHTTLFMNSDNDIIAKGYEKLKDVKLPKEIHIHRFLVGYSLDGSPESYQVSKEIEV